MKFIRTLLVFVFWGAIIQNNYSQTVSNNAFGSGESLKFVASYYMSSLWTDLAEINMEVSEIKTSSNELYRLKCTASTYQAWDSYFKIRDLYESYVDKVSVRPLLFKRSIDEGGYTKNIKYVYKWNSGLVNATSQKKTYPEEKKVINISNETYDLVSVLYMIRNINFKSMTEGEVLKVKVLIDLKEEFVYVKYSGIENISVGDYGKKQCYKLTVSLKDDKILKGKDANNIWLTTDKNRVPVLIKAEIPVGSIQVRLVEMNGLLN